MDTDSEVLGKAIRVAQKVAHSLDKQLGVDGFNIFVASGAAAEQTVFHFHLHVIPRRTGDEPKLAEWWKPRIRNVSQEELKSLASRVRVQEK